MTVPLTPSAPQAPSHTDALTDDLMRLKGLTVDAIDTALVITDTSGRFLYVNEEFRRLIGFSPSELRGNTLGDLCRLHSDSCRHLDEILTAVHLEGQRKGELLIHDRNGHPMWVSFSATAVNDASQRRRLIATVCDITYAKLHDTLQRKVLDALLQDKPLHETLSLLCLEVGHMVQDVSMSVLRVTDGKLSPLAAPTLPDWYNSAVEGLPIGPVVGSCGTAAWRGEPVMVNDMRTDPLWAPFQDFVEPLGYTACWSTPVKDKAGRVIGTFAFYSTKPFVLNTFVQSIVDICTQLCTLAFEKGAFQERIQYLAHHDALTGLPNRGFFQARLSEEAARASRQNTQLALHLIDLDRFKEVNDTLGHMVGDEVLITVAETLRRLAGPGDVLARLGGDEFVFLQVGVASRAQAEARAEALVNSLHEDMHAQFGHQGPDVGASLGFALYPDEGPTLDRLTRHADMALYRAKTDGRGCWRAFDATMAEALRRRRRLEADLRDALAHGQRGLSLVYQPQFCLNLNRIIGYEALVRWTHPELGPISPCDFIPVAEEAGLITALGQWILSRALETAATWPTHLTLAVNLSPVQIFEGDLTRYVQQELIRTGFRPQRLELEVTEGVLIENTDRALHILRQLKGLGVRIAMDDFGTGFSSLSYLQTFPFDVIKIDRSFVEGLTSSPDRKMHKHGIPAEAIVRAVIGMAHAIHVPVIAEGVETQDQLDLLRDMGADAVQGYLIGRPQAYCLSEASPVLLAAGQR
ncbi:EAL domain-containing protein [Asticcacaulis sp.]|uniref:sensor domain-containing protein n=1 Tax=Asticcacaulis sp. TaxID=1872648 RepID=UPI00391926AC